MDATVQISEKARADSSNDQPWSPCDVVMKGGITSGVVYPALVVELAKSYRFKNIGGASAGAIAAACAAAAEYGRQHGNTNAIRDLDQLSKDLGAPGLILSLFEPTPATAPLFNVATAVIGTASVLLKVARAIGALLSGFWGWTLIALVIDGLIAWWLCRSGVQDPVIWLLALVSWLVVLVAAWVGGAWRCMSDAIPNNYLGLCNGSEPSPSKTPPLTDWLAARIDAIAGKASGKPLTFGDLWGMSPPATTPTPYADLPPEEKFQQPSQSLEEIRGDADINLEMMTTCLTLGRPFRLPFVERGFYIHPDDANTLFPTDVAKWLLANPPPPRYKEEAILYRALAPLVPLPLAVAFPVVVAARMSLSFPILLSALKLYSIDFSLARNIQAKAAIRALAGGPFDPDKLTPAEVVARLLPITTALSAKPCWFSDGGLTHNFPVYFFDQPLPSWPTFAIDLDGLPEGVTIDPTADQADFVWLPVGNNQGRLPNWNHIEDASGRASLLKFVTSIIDTMQNWNDSTQSVMPGYRDRIAHVQLAQDEGGLNLNMRPEVVKMLIARGRIAADVLWQEFGPANGAAPHWLNHRWVRYRSFMAMCERLLLSFHAGYSQNSTQPTYPSLVGRAPSVPPPSYVWEYPAQASAAKEATDKLDRAAGDIESAGAPFKMGAPHPQGELTVRPIP